MLAHRTYTTESVKRLFARWKKARQPTSSRWACWPITWKWIRRYEKPAEEFLHEELEYVVVESWEQAERGLDFIRAELDGRATFLVHPEPNGQTHGHLPEPAIGPETGIAARLSDSLRLTNGFKDRATDLLPRAFAVLPGGRSRRGAAPVRKRIRTCISCCPMAFATTDIP